MNYTPSSLSELNETAEMKFAFGVVTYITNQHYPGIMRPYPPEFTDTLTFNVCVRIRDICIAFRENCPNAFEELFNDFYEKTCLNFCTIAERCANLFLNLGYTHSRFLQYCSEISEYAVSMYRECCSDAFDIAIFAIFRVLWVMKHHWDSFGESPTFSEDWRCLDTFCKFTGSENKENECWHANT